MIRTLLLAVVAVASLTYGIFGHWEVKDRDNRIALLNRELAAARDNETLAMADAEKARKELAEANDNLARLKRERDAALARAKSGAGAGEAPASAETAGVKPEPQKAGGGNPWAKMFETEEGRKMMKTQMSMMTKMQYGDLARLLKLSPQDADQVMALLADRQAAMAEHQFKLMSGGQIDEAAMREVSAKTKAVKDEYDEKLKAVLGEQKFGEMQDYDRTLGERMMLAQYEQQFNASGAPLQQGQRDELLKIMGDERKKSPPPIFDPSGQNPGRGLDQLQDDAALDRFLQQEADYQRRVLASATRALSPDQVNALQKAFEQMAEMQKFGIKMGREMMKGGNASAVPAPAAR